MFRTTRITSTSCNERAWARFKKNIMKSVQTGQMKIKRTRSHGWPNTSRKSRKLNSRTASMNSQKETAYRIIICYYSGSLIRSLQTNSVLYLNARRPFRPKQLLRAKLTQHPPVGIAQDQRPKRNLQRQILRKTLTLE